MATGILSVYYLTKGNKMKIHKNLLPQLGTLEVYTLQTAEEISQNIPPVEVYWCDEGSPQGFGPFNTIYDALVHYKEIINATKNGTRLDGQIEESKLIRVNFRTKHKVTSFFE